MVTLLYFAALIFSVAVLCGILLFNKKIDSIFVSVTALVCINNLGRYLIAISDTTDMAVWSTQVMYIGGVYCPVAFIFLITELCDLKMPEWLKNGLVLCATTILGFVMTIGKSDLYYADVRLGYADGYNYLDKTYGPVHMLYPIFMAFCAGVLLFYIIYAIRKRNVISVRTVTALSIGGITLEVLYLIEKIMDSQISYISFGYLVAVFVMGTLFTRINKFDMTSNIAKSIDKLKEFGYIELDLKNRFINANQYARELFPEIDEEWKIDVVVPRSGSFLYKEIISWAISMQGTGTKTVKIEDLYFELHVNEIFHRGDKKIGRFIELIDRTDEVKYTLTIREHNENLEKEVELKTEDLLHIKDKMVYGMASMIESRDNSTGGHIKRTSDVVKIFADRLNKSGKWNLPQDYVEMVAKAAPMHDLGKITVNDSVLRKNGRFTNHEYEEMKKHSEEGAKIVEEILRDAEDEQFVNIAKNIAHYHHEQWDGKGYPLGLVRTNIPLEARIMALADVFDALVSKRCYKEAYTYDQAFSIISDSLGTHFDPELGKVFIECRDELEALYNGNVE